MLPVKARTVLRVKRPLLPSALLLPPVLLLLLL
jgi:hypothetical protein